MGRYEKAAKNFIASRSQAKQWAVKCDECKQTIRMTTNVRESYAGGTCEQCKAEGRPS